MNNGTASRPSMGTRVIRDVQAGKPTCLAGDLDNARLPDCLTYLT